MSINFSNFKTNVSVWLNRQYSQFENEFQKKNASEYESLIKKEQLTVNNYIRSLIDEINFTVRNDLKDKIDFKEVRRLYEEYQSMTKPYNLSLMEYKVGATPKKDSVFERIPADSEKAQTGKGHSVQRNKEQNMIIGASIGGLIGAGIGFKAVNPLMFKMITTPTGLFLGAIVGGYIALQLLPEIESNKKPNHAVPVQTKTENQSYKEVATTLETNVQTQSIDKVLQERKIQVGRKLNEIVDHMEQNYKKLLATANE
ncbi:hypothetical protein [Niallia taxi]|uniref:hypothetical protein n=1 Tax=Niallia taxi TaxID=2499688 RepID=UPI00254D87CA|nr:hypothetical protein [Niallia taxi]MDK8643440.1 hypothetical protein [Niallia taxi]